MELDSIKSTLNKRTDRNKILLLFVSVFYIFLLYPASITPFYTRGEAREAQVVRSVLAAESLSGVILPLRNGDTIPSKPPLFHWASAGFSLISGFPLEVATRLTSALAGLLALFIVLHFVSSSLSPTVALATIAMLATTLEWMRSSSVARVDMLFSAFTISATLLIFGKLQKLEKLQPATVFDSATIVLALSGAVLTKGPAGLVLPLVVGFIHALTTMSLRQLPWRSVSGILIVTTLLCSAWYYLSWQIGGESFLDVHLMRENVARVVGIKSYNTGHAAPWYANVGLFCLAFLPWSLLLPLTGFVLWQERILVKLDPLPRFSVIWLAVYLLFFSLTASKRTVYLLPALPAAAILVAYAFHCSISLEKRNPRLTKLTKWLFGILSLLVSLALVCLCCLLLTGQTQLIANAFIAKKSTLVLVTYIAKSLEASRTAILLICVAGLLPIAVCIRSWKTPLSSLVNRLALSFGFLAIVIGLVVHPLIAAASTPQGLAAFIKNRLSESDRVFQFRNEYYTLNFYLGRNLPIIDSNSLEMSRARELGGYIVFEGRLIEEVKSAITNLEILHQSSRLDAYKRDRFIFARFAGSRPPAPACSHSQQMSCLPSAVETEAEASSKIRPESDQSDED